MKRTLHFNKTTLKDIDILINLLGIEGYGDMPKALKFSVTYTLLKLKEDEKVIPTLNTDEFTLWFSSVKKLKKDRLNNEMIAELQKGNTFGQKKVPKGNTKGKKDIVKIN
jgi:hypothetical protein